MVTADRVFAVHACTASAVARTCWCGGQGGKPPSRQKLPLRRFRCRCGNDERLKFGVRFDLGKNASAVGAAVFGKGFHAGLRGVQRALQLPLKGSRGWCLRCGSALPGPRQAGHWRRWRGQSGRGCGYWSSSVIALLAGVTGCNSLCRSTVVGPERQAGFPGNRVRGPAVCPKPTVPTRVRHLTV